MIIVFFGEQILLFLLPRLAICRAWCLHFASWGTLGRCWGAWRHNDAHFGVKASNFLFLGGYRVLIFRAGPKKVFFSCLFSCSDDYWVVIWMFGIRQPSIWYEKYYPNQSSHNLKGYALCRRPLLFCPLWFRGIAI